LVWLYTASL